MRKVRPEDEIPVEFLSERAIKRRVADFRLHLFSVETKTAMRELYDYIHSDTRKCSVEFMERIYSTLDMYMAEIHQYTPCRKGCAHCCNGIPVEVSFLEAAYINDKTGRVVNKKAKNLPKAIAAAKGACPFLDSDTATCDIYEHRPLACRIFASIDTHELCISGETKHQYHGFKSNEFWSWVGQAMFEISLSSVGSKKKRYQPISEIRSYFK